MRKGVVSTRETLLTYGEDCCVRAGYAVRRPESGREPDAVAETEISDQSFSDGRPRFAGQPFFDGGPVAIEPLDTDELTPTTVLSRHADNRSQGRKTLFVVPPADRSRLTGASQVPWTTGESKSTTSESNLATDESNLATTEPTLTDESFASTVVELLSVPVGVETDGSERVFYNGPDRIALPDDRAESEQSESGDGNDGDGDLDQNVGRTGGYALCAVAEPDARLEWREELGGGASRDESETRIVLRADGEVVAAVDELADLRCPPASVFPYSYRRGADKRMHVRDPEGVVVGSFNGVTDMRQSGFEPVPMPLVPEHLFAESLDGTWAVVVAAATASHLYTSGGVYSLEAAFGNG
ncbi:hypothetical protein AUR64_04500 [Haloprofundus marisrubri]|uniref:Uncharacterized protein n=1 Tax=Haloprofundus marisrubri TaxID=1514971 RepID=A0A0W1RDK6_9EURY|nr:hypothetical protein [Haloprofundus marisrubri]KTG11197.1 hypothetical protein AUR64_04500 [Haloprofundus marisrubri]